MADLKAYSKLAAVTLMGAPAASHAQIVYTDLDPDVYVNGIPFPAEFQIDIDADGIDDVNIVADYIATYNQYCGVLGFRSVELAGKFKPEGFICDSGHGRRSPFRAELDQPIDGNQSQWIRKGHLNRWTDGPCTMGFWEGGQEGFMAIRIPESGGFRYGWIRMDVINRYSVLIQDYALQMTPNQMIRAGESPSCPLPASLVATPSGPGAELSWTGDPDHVNYAVQVILSSDGGIRTFTTDSAYLSLGTLPDLDAYSWNVRASCTGGLMSSTANGGSILTPRLSSPDQQELSISPNPANAQVTLQASTDHSGIIIRNLYGQALESCFDCSTFSVDVGQWPAGIYFVQSGTSVEQLIVVK